MLYMLANNTRRTTINGTSPIILYELHQVPPPLPSFTLPSGAPPPPTPPALSPLSIT